MSGILSMSDTGEEPDDLMSEVMDKHNQKMLSRPVRLNFVTTETHTIGVKNNEGFKKNNEVKFRKFAV